jgi:eukaryotic-like serine/threonine-protein kinase
MAAATVLGDRYELRVRLGSGGAGTVWRGFDTTLHREVAVKLITLDTPTGPDPDTPIQRFRREARVVAGLNHPNIVAAYDFGLADDVAYLVMELVIGSSMAHRLRIVKASGAKGIDELTVVRLAQQVCSGLATAHRARLVHRDLKPSNLMLSDATGQVKIVDFGIARVAEQSRLTRTGSYLGTLPYMAPEQMEASPLDARTDLYSLGCLLHELVAGRSAYNAGTPMQWMAAHQLGTPARLRTHAPYASAMLEALILQLLAKDLAHRPPDADAVGMTLAGIEAELRRPTPPARLEQTTAAAPVPAPSARAGERAALSGAASTTVPRRDALRIDAATAPARGDATTAPGGPADVTTAPSPTVPGPVSPAPVRTVAGAVSPAPVPSVLGPVSPAPAGWRPAYAGPPPARPSSAPPSSAPPASSAPPLSGRPLSGRPMSAPPVPVASSRRRRSWLVAAAVVLVVGVFAVGYEVWPGHGASNGRSYVPRARDCYPADWANAVDADATTIWAVDDRTASVPCTGTHAFEIVSVATPVGTAATTPPGPTSSTVVSIYQGCADDADTYFGGDWRGAYAWLGVALPDADAWGRGAHWHACVLVPTATWEGQLTQSRTSLFGGRRGSQPAAIACIDAESRPADCDGPHTREAVGVYRAAAGPFQGAPAGAAVFGAACELKVAQYLGLKSRAQYHNQSVGYSWYPQAPDAEQWNLGNRGALCTAFAQPTGATMIGSVGGLGNKPPDG